MPHPNAALRVIRQRTGVSVRQLADAAGLAPSTVSRIETGSRTGSLATLAALAQALDVTPEAIGGRSTEVAA